MLNMSLKLTCTPNNMERKEEQKQGAPTGYERKKKKHARKRPKRGRNGSVMYYGIHVNRCHYVYALALHNGK